MRSILHYLPLLLAAATSPAQQRRPAYTLDVRVDPSTGSIAVAGRLDHACIDDSMRLWLNQTFRIDELRDSAGPITAHFDTAGPSMPYSGVTRRLVMERPACAISFRYHGVIRDTLETVNTISPTLVELASYAGWYFERPDQPQVTFDVTLRVPAGFMVTGNGRVVAATTTSGEQVVRFRDAAPGFDIVLVAAVGLRRTSAALGRLTVAMYSPVADSAADQATVSDLLGALRSYQAWYGSTTAAGELRVIYSPRAGYGYSRVPLIISSARYRDRQLAQPLGRMRVMQGAAHELAHFWWSIADVGAPDDWINEGLAEYSAFAAVAAEFGPAARDSLLARYRRDAAQTQTATTIGTTPAESPDRYVNRYEKPALLLAELEDGYGAGRVRDALRAIHRQFDGTRSATTAGVLSIIRQLLGPEAEARLRTCLTEIGWRDRCPT